MSLELSSTFGHWSDRPLPLTVGVIPDLSFPRRFRALTVLREKFLKMRKEDRPPNTSFSANRDRNFHRVPSDKDHPDNFGTPLLTFAHRMDPLPKLSQVICDCYSRIASFLNDRDCKPHQVNQRDRRLSVLSFLQDQDTRSNHEN
jgi:hypothetical protein